MPELPDIAAYIHALKPRILNRTLQRAQIAGPFLLRTADPPVSAAEGRVARELRRIGKRIAIGLDKAKEERIWLVLHLMIAGRLHWKNAAAVPDGRRTLAAFVFDNGCLTLTEAGTRKRAALHVVQGEDALESLDPGGIEVFTAAPAEFAAALTRENHTLKRSLTDARVFSGIGNAYSDEILHRARMSPIARTAKLTPEQIETLRLATLEVLKEWMDRLSAEAEQKFPEKVTAFRPEMAVHGKFNQPCPRCGAKIQRIRYADNETNYCATCQTGGRLLADRGLSRLLREDWPRTLEELENRRKG